MRKRVSRRASFCQAQTEHGSLAVAFAEGGKRSALGFRQAFCNEKAEPQALVDLMMREIALLEGIENER